MRAQTVTAITCLTLAVTGCGSSSEEPTEACIITATGSELCGESAAAWCRQFAGMSGDFQTDLETSRACAAVGADPLYR